MRTHDLKRILQLVREYGRLEINILSAKNCRAMYGYISDAGQLLKKIKRELRFIGFIDKEIITDYETQVLINFVKSKLKIKGKF